MPEGWSEWRCWCAGHATTSRHACEGTYILNMRGRVAEWAVGGIPEPNPTGSNFAARQVRDWPIVGFWFTLITKPNRLIVKLYNRYSRMIL